MGMLKKITEKIKSMTEKQSKRKLVENCAIIIIIGIILMIAGNSLLNSSKKEEDPENPKADAAQQTSSVTSNEVQDLYEKKLAALLSQIEGAGKVDVMITYTAGREVFPAYDHRESQVKSHEKDNSGGTREVEENSNESSIAYEEGQGVKTPIILKELHPVVKGVVVVAEGAGDPSVQEAISKAVQVLMDIPIHKVQVFERRK